MVEPAPRQRRDGAHRFALHGMARRVPQRRARHGAEGGDEAVDLRGRERLALHEDGGERRAPPAGRGSNENVAGRIVHPEIAERVTRRRHVPFALRL